MKLLGWMHRKFWQNTGDLFRELPTGPTCNYLAIQPSTDDRRHYFAPMAPEKGLDWMFKEPPGASPLLYEGLLAIGTFGSPVIPAAAAMEEIAEKVTEEATERNLMLMTEELHKLLAEDAEKEKSSGDHRISSVGAGSAGKALEECPLQGFLFGSTVDQVAATAVVAGRRASLAELFMKSRAVEAGCGGGTMEESMHVMMMKMLKYHRFHGGGGKCNASETNKLPKILRIFHKKIHPENATASKEFEKPYKHEEKEKSYMPENCSNKSTDNGNQMAITKKDFKREGISSFRCAHSYPESPRVLGRNSTNGNRGHWIKTDADYLVLEL